MWEVVKAMNGDKALGPNGFAMAFFQVCWVVLNEDIMTIFCDLDTSGKFQSIYGMVLLRRYNFSFD